MTTIANNAGKPAEYRDGWNEAASGADYISNPYSGLRQPTQYEAWADGYIAFLDQTMPLACPMEHEESDYEVERL